MNFYKTIILGLLLVLSAGRVWGQGSFEAWKAGFIERAAGQGTPQYLLDELAQIQPYERAVKSDRNQAEFKKFLWDYLKTAVSASRIQTGQEKFSQHQALFYQVGQQTGVSPQIIAAIWGIETAYGGFTGKVPVMRSMATLAHEGRRKKFFEEELLAALKLIERGDIPGFHVQGSWAGGLGYGQFIPTSYRRYGVDFNGDGRVNLWQVGDGMASIGNYLQRSGWQRGYRWGREVTLTDGFDYTLANSKAKKSLATWSGLGVRDAYGQPLPPDSVPARLFVPAGRYGPKFLLYKNFDVIKRYNNSDAYALAVGLLSNRIAGKPDLVASWPTNAKRLTKNDIKIIQTALNAYGFNAGKVDGVFGNGTRRALQAYQAANGMVADGFLTVDLYREIITNR